MGQENQSTSACIVVGALEDFAHYANIEEKVLKSFLALRETHSDTPLKKWYQYV